MNQLEYYLENSRDFAVKKHKTKDLYIIKYRHLGIDWSQPYALEARGIILDGDSNIVARPYKKFFNYRELKGREDLPEEIKRLSEWEDGEYTVIEKLDGSMVTVSQHEGEMIYASSGNIQGGYPHKFKMWFDKNLTPMQKRKLKDLTKKNTLMFEYISPDERIVVNYPKEDMVLHGIINTETGDEIFKTFVFEAIAESIGVDTANRFDADYEMLMRVLKQDFEEELIEGFVVRFESGKRVKLKTEEYMRLHPDYTMFMGEVNTKNKILTFVDRIDSGAIDDLLAIINERGDNQAIKIAHRVIELDNEFRELMEHAGKIISQDGFTKKRYAIDVGDEKPLDRIVLNFDKPRAIKKIRKNFILEEMGK